MLLFTLFHNVNHCKENWDPSIILFASLLSVESFETNKDVEWWIAICEWWFYSTKLGGWVNNWQTLWYSSESQRSDIKNSAKKVQIRAKTCSVVQNPLYNTWNKVAVGSCPWPGPPWARQRPWLIRALLLLLLLLLFQLDATFAAIWSGLAVGAGCQVQRHPGSGDTMGHKEMEWVCLFFTLLHSQLQYFFVPRTIWSLRQFCQGRCKCTEEGLGKIPKKM